MFIGGRLLAFFSLMLQHHHRSVRESMAAAMFSPCLRDHVRIPTCMGDTQLDPDFLKKVAPLLRDLQKSQTNLFFKPLERKSAFFTLAQDHRQTGGFDDGDVKTFAVDAGIRLVSCVLMLLHNCADDGLRNGPQICSKPMITHSPSERWRVLKLPSTGSLAGAETKKRAFCVMQHVRFKEDLRDDGLEPWQPVVAHWLDGFSGTVPDVSVLRWQMRQQKQTGPVIRAMGYLIRVKTDRRRRWWFTGLRPPSS